jgi:hypothetical protein
MPVSRPVHSPIPGGLRADRQHVGTKSGRAATASRKLRLTAPPGRKRFAAGPEGCSCGQRSDRDPVGGGVLGAAGASPWPSWEGQPAEHRRVPRHHPPP